MLNGRLVYQSFQPTLSTEHSGFGLDFNYEDDSGALNQVTLSMETVYLFCTLWEAFEQCELTKCIKAVSRFPGQVANGLNSLIVQFIVSHKL